MRNELDFTLQKYKELLKTLSEKNFAFYSFDSFLRLCPKNSVIFRHDVDKLPINSLIFSKIENELSIQGTYYFRIVKESFNPGIIEQIANLNHEIGYHYEDLALAKGNIDEAFDLFNLHLEKIRKYYPVKTICMHGSPTSPWDNRKIWDKYDYKTLGIIGEPYFDVDYSNVLYLTDTGRRWDGNKVSVRDKVDKNALSGLYEFHSTQDIIQAINNSEISSQIMFTFHPQRWSSATFPWAKELVMQSVKNIVKRLIYVR